MSTVILSPHLDDAVLSCWHILTQPGEVVVVNVFAGVPTSHGAPAWWDAYPGATDSGRRVRERIAEDRRALAIAERTAVNLDLLDEQYRERDQPLTPITTAIEAVLATGSHIYAPAAFADHTDRALARAAALELRGRGFSVSLYADIPHATLHGWPARLGFATPDGCTSSRATRSVAFPETSNFAGDRFPLWVAFGRVTATATRRAAHPAGTGLWCQSR